MLAGVGHKRTIGSRERRRAGDRHRGNARGLGPAARGPWTRVSPPGEPSGTVWVRGRARSGRRPGLVPDRRRCRRPDAVQETPAARGRRAWSTGARARPRRSRARVSANLHPPQPLRATCHGVESEGSPPRGGRCPPRGPPSPRPSRTQQAENRHDRQPSTAIPPSGMRSAGKWS